MCPLAGSKGNTSLQVAPFLILFRVSSSPPPLFFEFEFELSLSLSTQVARQQGEYLADLFTRNRITGNPDTADLELVSSKLAPSRPFEYNHRGSAAYVGGDNAVFDDPKVGALTGRTAGLMWKSFETFSQISFRNQCLVAVDWVRTKLFGRDISRV